MTESLDTIQLADPGFWAREDRMAVFARFRRERPVARQTMPDGSASYWSLTRHAECRDVSRRTSLFRSQHGTGLVADGPELAYEIGGMLNRDAPLHPALRRILARVFTPRFLESTEQGMDAAARSVVGAVSERGHCDFAPDIANRMPLTVICDMLSVPDGDDRDELARLTLKALDPVAAAQSLEAFRALNRYGEDLARRRRRAPGGDLVSRLVAAEVDGAGLTDLDIGIYFQLLVTAGIETTSSSLAQGMHFLATHPAQWRDWRESYDELAGTAIEEIVRYASPVVHFGRRVERDVVIGGQPVAAGDQVVFWYISANRDETVFAHPECFDIRRSPNDHVGFGGGGPHHCLGLHLARREMHHLFRVLFETLPDLDIDLDGARSRHGLFINGMERLPCRFTPRRMAS
ncbi:MAG: cytochrome P450 [Alphaproteobacteria bacterium]|nr:cytochrome P450 [Alphaproteobacteria bacterium]